ncbi:MAG: hypothetical protein IKJ49_02110 [Bacteroidaceae bacterium]|nr:hypothetical protein [Bacteroidaceae bacterium]
MVTFGMISYMGSINVLAKIMFGATVMWVLKERFRGAYLKVMYFFAAVSLIFFALEFIGFKIPDLVHVAPNRNSIFIFSSLNNVDKLRNCGPFWEPGAFACYLILVPILYIDNLKTFVVNNKKKAIVLLLALITTISTTGYICLFILTIYYYLTQTKNKFTAYFIYLPLAMATIYIAYTQLDFMNDKIESQTEASVEMDGEFSNHRLGSLLFDLHYIKKHPIVGNGLNEQTRYADHPFLWGEELGHGNAFSNYTAQMGVVALIVYFVLLYFAFGNKLIVPIIIALLFQGEQLMNYPLFSALPFIILFPKLNKFKRKKINRYETYSNNNDGVQPQSTYTSVS